MRKNYLREAMPGGESLMDVWARLEVVAIELHERLTRGTTLAVDGHYFSNRILVGMLHDLPFEEALRHRGYRPGNASAYVLDFERNGEVLALSAASRRKPSGDQVEQLAEHSVAGLEGG